MPAVFVGPRRYWELRTYFPVAVQAEAQLQDSKGRERTVVLARGLPGQTVRRRKSARGKRANAKTSLGVQRATFCTSLRSP